MRLMHRTASALIFFFIYLFILLTRKKLITNTCYFNYENIYIYMAKKQTKFVTKKKTNKQTN